MRNRMLGLGCLCSVALVTVACARSENQRAAESAAAVPPATTPASSTAAAAPATAPSLSLADVAGKWNMRSVPESGTDTTATTYVLTATRDTSGWKLEFPKGPTVPVRVEAVGDSIISQAGPYSSVRRKGVQVTTNSVFHRQGDRLVGTTVAHYKTTRADSVLRLRTEGTRAP